MERYLKYSDLEAFIRDHVSPGTFSESFIRLLDHIPSADVVEVVHCKDCKRKSRCYARIEMQNCIGVEFTKHIDWCSFGLKE